MAMRQYSHGCEYRGCRQNFMAGGQNWAKQICLHSYHMPKQVWVTYAQKILGQAGTDLINEYPNKLEDSSLCVEQYMNNYTNIVAKSKIQTGYAGAFIIEYTYDLLRIMDGNVVCKISGSITFCDNELSNHQYDEHVGYNESRESIEYYDDTRYNNDNDENFDGVIWVNPKYRFDARMTSSDIFDLVCPIKYIGTMRKCP